MRRRSTTSLTAHQWVYQLIIELNRLDAGRPAEMEGCTEEELAQIEAESPFAPIPSDYRVFMRLLGRRPGLLFTGTDLTYPACLGTRQYALECAREEDPDVPVTDTFFIGHHQGYLLYYFRLGDERVWTHELAGNSPPTAAPNIRAFVEAELYGVSPRVWPQMRERAQAQRNRQGTPDSGV
ncbi:hypothetical protein RIF23_18345 [Lipingzhangella sp. LS1_29]|uniref:Knr4/Smi1-like domain-containing protein n=1 Tax=Lipingzhangella rawalii TaxID=2055835 RepID=A0ABU2HAH6_9ACTN|nr:hypothetical protein [Lipingzhangella rawalii]MDS1272253.1 hypothetical protein [Lipingzhangella rawalii]